jgi:hypothetical protein
MENKKVGPILSNIENKVVTRKGRLYRVNDGGGDLFFVVAQNKDQVRKFLVNQGDYFNLQRYTVEREPISAAVMVFAEVSGELEKHEGAEFLEKHDITDWNLDCDD